MFVLSDLDIGMNDWMVPKLTWDDSLSAGSRQGAVGRGAGAGRRRSIAISTSDGDGIPYRTLPGVHPKGAYFTRGSGHNQYGAYTEDGDEYAGGARPHRPQDSARGDGRAGAGRAHRRRARRWGSSPIGGCHAACMEAIDQMAEDGIALDYMRVRGLPVRRGGAGASSKRTR